MQWLNVHQAALLASITHTPILHTSPASSPCLMSVVSPTWAFTLEGLWLHDSMTNVLAQRLLIYLYILWGFLYHFSFFFSTFRPHARPDDEYTQHTFTAKVIVRRRMMLNVCHSRAMCLTGLELMHGRKGTCVLWVRFAGVFFLFSCSLDLCVFFRLCGFFFLLPFVCSVPFHSALLYVMTFLPSHSVKH